MNPEPISSNAIIHASMDLVFKTRKKNRKCIRLQKEKIDVLKVYFNKYPYPKKEQYEDYAKEIDETAAKVENWFKYQRRTYKTTGIIKDFKERKILSKDKEKILEDAFRICIKPHPDRYKQLAIMLECDVKPIKKWFSYRRRKLNQIQIFKKKPNNFSDFSSNSNSNSGKTLNDSPLKKEAHTDSSIENVYLLNYDNKNNKNLNMKSNNEIKKEFNLIMKNECHGENSSVFHTSNDSHSNSNGKKATASNFNISNLNENNSNSNDNNHDLPSYSNDSNSNSNEHLNENRNTSNSNRNSNSNKNSNSNDNSHNSQFKTNSTSNMNYNGTSTNHFNNSKAETGIEPMENSSHQDMHKKNSKYLKHKGQIRKSQCNLLQSNENDDSNNSSNQQKYSDDSYNLNYIINTLSNKNNVQNIKPNNDEYMFQNTIKNENQKYEGSYNPYASSIHETLLKNNNYENIRNNNNPSEMDYRQGNPNLIMNNVNNNQNVMDVNQGYINYAPNIQNIPICIPVQLNQSFNNQAPFNGYMDPNKNQTVPVIYQYQNMNQNNINYKNMRNNGMMPQNMYINQQNLNNNYEIVPNYMIQNTANNSFQLLQVGMSLRPVSNVLVMPPERLNSIQRNNMQYPQYFICPINNNMSNQNNNSNLMQNNNIDDQNNRIDNNINSFN